MRLWLLLGVAIVLLAGACGGSGRLSASTYRSRLARVGKDSDAAQHAVEAGFHATSTAQLGRVLTRFAAAERRIGDDVASLKPPKDAEAANAELAAGLRDTASETGVFAPRVEKLPSVRAALALLSKTPQTKGGREIDDALAKLKKLGYLKKVS